MLNELHRAMENEDVPERLRAEAQITAGRLAHRDSRLGDGDDPPRRATADLPAQNYFQREAERAIAEALRDSGRPESPEDGAEP